MTETDLVATLRHREPFFNLADEPWIDVQDASGVSRLASVSEVLRDGHTLQLAAKTPLDRHAQLRFLIALGYIVYSHTSKKKAWQAALDDGAALPQDAVEYVIDRMRPHLWLRHPEQPFAQQEAVIGRMKKLAAALSPIEVLRNDIPSKSNPSWFVRQSGQRIREDHEVAQALLVRHYWAAPGNETPNEFAGGGRVEGGITALTNAGRSYLVWQGTTVAQLIAANLVSDIAKDVTLDSLTFFEEPYEQLVDDPLWCYTATTAYTYIAYPDGERPQAIRTPGWHKDVAKKVREIIVGKDPHVMRVPGKTPTDPYRQLRYPAMTSMFPLLQSYLRDVPDRSILLGHSLIASRATVVKLGGRVPLEFLNLDTGGSATGPIIENAAISAYDPKPFTLSDQQRRDALADGLEMIGAAKGSAKSKVRFYVKEALPDVESARDGAERHLWDALESRLHDFLTEAISGAQMTPRDDIKRDVMRAALAAFDSVTDPYIDALASSARIVENRNRLRSSLWTI